MESCGLEEGERLLDAIGSMVFRVESTVLDRRIFFDGSEEVYALCEMARFRQRGIPPDLVQDAREVVAANLPYLDHSRAVVLGKTTHATNAPAPVWTFKPGPSWPASTPVPDLSLGHGLGQVGKA